MNILLVMVPLSIVVLIGAAVAFFWAVENGQFDDMDTPALLPLTDVSPDAVVSAEDTEVVEDADSPTDRNDSFGNL